MKYICTLFFLIFNILSSAQNSNIQNDGYYKSLELHVIFLKDIQANLDTVLVQKQPYLSNFSGEINGVYVIMVGRKSIHERTKNRKHISLVVINALKFEKGIPIIYVVDFDVSRKRKKYTMANVDRSKIQLSSDCNNLELTYRKVN